MPETQSAGLKDLFAGQEELVTLLEDEIVVSRDSRQPLPHMVFSGAPGLGKTKLADALAKLIGVDTKSVMGGSLNEQSLSEFIASTNCVGYDDEGKLTDPLARRPSIRVFEEVEKMKPDLMRDLHLCLECGPDGIRKFQAKMRGDTRRPWIWVPDFTAIFCTNYLGAFRKRGDAVISRCPIKYTFQPYNEEQMREVVITRCADKRLKIEDAAVEVIASRSLGIPRGAVNIIDRCGTKLAAMVSRGDVRKKVITAEVVEQTLEMLGLDQLGLDNFAIKYLHALAHSEGAKMGIKTIASHIGLDTESVEVDIEPLLLRAGLIDIGSGGRTITDKGMSHIGRGQANSIKARILRN